MNGDLKEVTVLGELQEEGKRVGTIYGVCIVEDLKTLKSSALVAFEYDDGRVELTIIPISNA